MTRCFQMIMLSTTKFYNFSRSTTFILVIWLSDMVVVTLFTNFTYSSYINFVNNVTNTLSDEEITKIKVVDLDEFYNFYIHAFFQLKSFNVSK